jgi:DnaJ-class molecular chaperone
MIMRHQFPIVEFDGKPADFCARCGARKREGFQFSVEKCPGSRAVPAEKDEEEEDRTESSVCVACNGSGVYDHNGSPPCGSCNGTGERQ